MWEMIESDYDLECDNDCGLPGPPPIFNLPPPPRPDFITELDKCSEHALSDFEMCEAIPVSFKYDSKSFKHIHVVKHKKSP